MSDRAVTSPEISAREAEVLALLGEHLSNAEIGARLFISVRTVESHVAALLRKLDVPDRRALAHIATGRRTARHAPALPSPLTSFVGRTAERAGLADAVRTHRLVTAVGPGGVGKTRLALAVAQDVAGSFGDVIWFVDLVPLTDATMVGAAVAMALGIGDQDSRMLDESVFLTLADRRALLVMDNCEHVRTGVTPFVERVLRSCPGVTVLATSRARLVVPFEHVYAVPPMSLASTGPGDSDAAALLAERAEAVGWSVGPQQQANVAAVCQALGGVALAIELAAARLPVLGFDGLASALSDQLRLLTGGQRAEDRHSSVRAMLDWGHALLRTADRQLLRRVSVFVAPFTARAAADLADVDLPAALDGLARLAEQSLLAVVPGPISTRYRALETIRQYGLEHLTAAGELDTVRSRHLRWCLAAARELAYDSTLWRARFDAVVDDLRAALGWAQDRPEHRAPAYDLALSLARLAFTRTLTGESQQCFEQAASLAADPATEAAALRDAAAVAGCRMLGDDSYRLYRAAADAALRAGDTRSAARDLATAAVTSYRFSGTFTTLPSLADRRELLASAHELARDDDAAAAAVALAEAFGTDLGSQPSPITTVTDAVTLAERAVDLAQRTNDPLAESAALDALTAAHYWAGDTFEAATISRRRVQILSAAPRSPAAARELADALAMAADTSMGIGDINAARAWATQLRNQPTLAERGYFATSRLLITAALAGNIQEVLAHGELFLDAADRLGRPQGPSAAAAAAAAAMIHTLRGDDASRMTWQAITDDIGATPRRWGGACRPVFDAIVLLHQGRAGDAADVLRDTDEHDTWVLWIWAHWHAALRAEAAALAGHVDARERIDAARAHVTGNPIATAIVERADAILLADPAGLRATAIAFDTAGCHYQRARTLALAGDHTAIDQLGFIPMGQA